MHFKRVMIEQVGQGLTLGTGLLDRLVLTAVLVRMWGDERFEAWATCMAVAGLISLFEFGFSIYFNNRLMEETEQNRSDEARRTFFIANTLFGLVGVLSFAIVATLTLWSSNRGLATDDSAKAAAIAIAAGQSLRIAASGFLYLYRANRQYSRFVFAYAAGDFVRVAASVVACLLGGGLVAVALWGTVAAVLLQVAYPVFDALRRFAPHRVGFALPRRDEIILIFRTSFAFFAQMVSIILLTSLPVLYLGDQQVAGGTVAAFVLMRTLSGVPRALLQQFGTVLGQECGRRIAVADGVGAARIVAEGARLFSVLSGIATGLLVGAGLEITRLWTGSADHFRWAYLLAAIVPMVLGAFAVLAHNILTTTNAPLFGTMARWLQLLLTALCVLVLPVEDLGLAMLIALSVGEVVGFIPLAYRGVSRLVPGTDGWFHARETVMTALTAVAAAGVTYGVLVLTPWTTTTGRVFAIGLAVFVNAIIVPWLGVRSGTRLAFLEFLSPRLLHRSAARAIRIL
jgi:hypothetical protein